MAKKTMLETHGLAGLYGMVDPEFAKAMQGTAPAESQALLQQLFSAGSKDKMTGQMFAMSQGEKDGREIFAFFGVVAAPKGTMKDMYKYPLAGMPREEHVDIILSTEEGVDRSDMNGIGIAGIIKSDHWKV